MVEREHNAGDKAAAAAGYPFPLPYEMQENNERIALHFSRALRTISNAVLGSGIKCANHFLNFHVDKDYNRPDPEQDLRQRLHQIGIPEEKTVAMMTAVYMQKRAILADTIGGVAMLVLVTAGVGNAVDISGGRIPDTLHHPGTAGTINTMIFLDANLTDGALINAIMSATEAKTKALAELGITDPDTGSIATGTSTDSMVIGCTGHGPALAYAGSGTAIGRGIGHIVFAATQSALRAI